MRLLPEQYAARIAFFQTRIATWTSEATNIGTTSAAVTALQTAVTSATAALSAQIAAQNAAKAATLNVKQLIATMDNLGMGIVEQVRTKARTAGDGVYVLADLPAPATPSARANPGKPFDFKVTLLDDGSLKFNFSCDNPVGTSGTMYQLFRGDPGQINDLTYIGGVGKKEFVDDSIPAGKTALMYKIQAVRSTAVGDWATFNVFFGTNAAGAATATLVEGTPAKLAA